MTFLISFQFRFTKSLIKHPLKSWISVRQTTQRWGECCMNAIFSDCQAHQPQTTACSHGNVLMQASASKQTTHSLSAVQSVIFFAWVTFFVPALSSSKNRSMMRGIFSVSIERRSCRICWRSLVPRAFNERWNPHQNTNSEVKQRTYTKTIETIEYPKNLSRRWLEVWLKSRRPENVTNIFINSQNRMNFPSSIFGFSSDTTSQNANRIRKHSTFFKLKFQGLHKFRRSIDPWFVNINKEISPRDWREPTGPPVSYARRTFIPPVTNFEKQELWARAKKNIWI